MFRIRLAILSAVACLLLSNVWATYIDDKLPANELRVLLNIAYEMGLDDDEASLLIAIRIHEDGAPGKECGVLYKLDGTPLFPYTFWPLSLQENAALCSRKIMLVYSGRFNRDLEKFAQWYAPEGAINDPGNLNRYWLPAVDKIKKRIRSELAMRCKDQNCNAEIEFVKNPKTGKIMPVEPRRVWILSEEGNLVKGRVCHFSTCPGAETFSKSRGTTTNKPTDK